MKPGTFGTLSAAAGWLPVELARTRSTTLSDLVSRTNKRSINWLADRLLMTAGWERLRGMEPSLSGGLEAMQRWLSRLRRRNTRLRSGEQLFQFEPREVRRILVGHYEMRYEQLVTDPEAALRGICAFLGEQYVPAMSEPHKPVPADPEREWLERVEVPKDRLAQIPGKPYIW